MAGVTPTGFEKKLLSDLISEVETEVRAQVDAKFLLTSDSASGQITRTTLAKIAEVWEVAEGVYAALNRSTALDDALDAAGALIGVPRVGDAASTALERFSGVAGTVVPAGSIVSDPAVPGELWRTLAPATIAPGDTFIEIEVTCNSVGPIEAFAGRLSKLNTPIAGITGVTNPDDAEPGRLRQSNAEYLLAQDSAVAALGAESEPALRANLRLIPGVTFVSIFVNETSGVVDSIPAHGMEVVIDGGSAVTIAETIFAYKPGTTPLSGTSTQNVTDVDGNTVAVKYTRPDAILIDVYVTLSKVDRSKYPGDVIAKQAMANAVNALLPSEPLVFTELYVPAYGIAGVQKVSLKVDTGSGQNENDVVPTRRQKVTTTPDRIHIIDG